MTKTPYTQKDKRNLILSLIALAISTTILISYLNGMSSSLSVEPTPLTAKTPPHQITTTTSPSPPQSKSPDINHQVSHKKEISPEPAEPISQEIASTDIDEEPSAVEPSLLSDAIAEPTVDSVKKVLPQKGIRKEKTDGKKVDRKKEVGELLKQGNSALSQASYSQAQEAFEAALKIQPNNPNATYGLGKIAMEKEQYSVASNKIGKAVRIRDNAKWRIELGNIYLMLGNKKRAIEQWKWIVKHHPNNARAQQLARENLTRNGVQVAHETKSE